VAAGDSLGEQFMYHYSRPENRESIQQRGLRRSDPGAELPKGVYLTPRRVAWQGMDSWRVNTSSLNIHEDPWPNGTRWKAYYSPHTIAPEHVSLADRIK
jgi:hypothetical protein